MKTFNYSPFICFLILMLSACGPNGDDSSILESNDLFGGKVKNIELHKDKSFEKIEIVNNKGAWNATSDNSQVARIVQEENQLVIVGVAQGETSVRVSDNEGNKASVKVKVDYNLLRPEHLLQTVIVRKGDSRIIETDKGAKIRPVSGNENIVFSFSGEDKLKIEGKELGRSRLACEVNYWPVKELDVQILDLYPLETVSKLEITGTPGKKQTLIRMGNGNYKVASADPSIAVGHILPYEGTHSDYFHNEAILEVESFDKRGTTTLTVTDAMNVSKTIMISVY